MAGSNRRFLTHAVPFGRALQVYVRLSEKLGLRDHLTVLTVILSKIGTNLKVFGAADDVIQDTLTLFSASLHPQHGTA